MFCRTRFALSLSLSLSLSLITCVDLLKAGEPPKPEVPASLASGAKSAGTAQINASGAATYSIPIVVPPGTNGVAPKLSLNYSSQSHDNELLGIGWSLSGLPTIERCAGTVAQDGFRGAIKYDTNARFCFGGARLMPVSGPTPYWSTQGTTYSTEIDSGLRFVASGVAGSGPQKFEVLTKKGEVMQFGFTSDSRIERAGAGQTSVRVWALNQMRDVNGNAYNVVYDKDAVAGDHTTGDYRPNRIEYTVNTGLNATRFVTFHYQSRPDNYPMYVGGSAVKTMKRLTNIRTLVGASVATAALVKDYRLTYELNNSPITKQSRLEKVQECKDLVATVVVGGNCLPAHTFAWQGNGNGFNVIPDIPISIDGTAANNRNRIGDFNGDGKADILTWGSNEFKVYYSTGNGFITGSPVSASLHPTITYAADVNGDGKSDIVSWDSPVKAFVFLSTGTGFVAEIGSGLYFIPTAHRTKVGGSLWVARLLFDGGLVRDQAEACAVRHLVENYLKIE